MQRYVMCLDCTKQWQELAAQDREDESTTQYVFGKARKHMRCDGLCNKALPPGEDCYALSVTQPGMRYSPWEGECLDGGVIVRFDVR